MNPARGHRRDRAAFAVPVALALALLTGCGTTVQMSGSGSSLGGTGLGEPALPGSSPGAGDLAGTSPTGAGTGAQAGASGTQGVRAGVPSGPGGTGALSGPPAVTGSTVEVGFFITKNVEKLFKAVGYENLSPGNQERQVNAIVAYINKRGGLKGKKIVPVFGIWDATAGNTVSQREAACAKWTQDHHVIAMVAESFDSFQGCSNRFRIPLMFGNPMPITHEEFRNTPRMATATTPADERLLPAWVDSLADAGFFKGTVTAPMKLGVVYLDTPPQGRSYKNNMVPALKRHGVTVTSYAALTANSVQESIAALQASVLKFHSEGVTNVMFMDTGGMALLFMAQAESQAYHPRYGLHSYSHPALLQEQAPKAQLTNAIGAGWFSTDDVTAENRPGDTPGGKTCLSIMKAIGEDMDTASTRESAFIYCDMALTLAAAANLAPVLSSTGIMQGLDLLGPSHTVGTAFRSDFRGRRDGPAELRPFAFVQPCSCFRYTSGPRQSL